MLVAEGPEGIGALIALWDLPGLLYLEHFAVHPDLRGGGLGGRLLRALLEESDALCCLEVEPPEANAFAQRRIGFYERLGFRLNPYPYLQPPLAAGRAPIPLQIMTHGRSVSETEFQGIRDLLYWRVYHTDPLA